jgi:hypothetical protein
MNIIVEKTSRYICPCFVQMYEEATAVLIKANDEYKKNHSLSDKPSITSGIALAIRNLLQIVETFSPTNYNIAKEKLKREPTCADLFAYYMDDKNGGRKIFAEKWPLLWKEIISDENSYFSGLAFGHQPDWMEVYINYLESKGLENFYLLHKEYFPVEEKTC